MADYIATILFYTAIFRIYLGITPIDMYRTQKQKAPEITLRSSILGADSRIRTCDPLITNEMLYQLSYTGI